MGKDKEKISQKWNRIKQTTGFRDGMLFLVFIVISASFWLILALNDSAQDSFNVNLRIINKPDSVTFISDIPEKLHVGVRDKGTNLLRNTFLRDPVMTIDFNEYANDGILRILPSDFQSNLKNTFGSTAQITSVSLDSLRILYTTNPGKRVPVVVSSKIIPSSGYTLEGEPTTSPVSVYVYGENSVLDTINFVRTETVDLKNLSETTSLNVELLKIRYARVIPEEVRLTIPIEPLVKKDALVTISTTNVPEGESLLLFPSKVPVSYFVAMSRLADDEDHNIELLVDYNDIHSEHTGKLHVSVLKYPERLKNLSLGMDSVEYAVVKQ